MAKIVNKRELAEAFDVSEQTLTAWQSDGLPILERGGIGQENRYDLAAVIAWRIEREVSKVRHESQRDRLTRLQADKLQREIAERDGVLVPVDQVRPIWEGRVLAAAAFMMTRHSRLAAELEATPGEAAKRDLLKEEDAAFLTKFGVHGELMQTELETLLATLPPGAVAQFWLRIRALDAESSAS